MPEGAEEVRDEKARVRALADVMQTRLFLVAINLTAQDDDQVIFETLNDRGTPLLKADLVKNWIFQVGEWVQADVETWPERFWADFDDPWWREEISQGRHNRSRIDIFLQYWLTMRTRDEVVTEQVFRAFTSHARPRMTDAASAEKLLGELRRDADTFRSFGQQAPDSVGGRFYKRVVKHWSSLPPRRFSFGCSRRTTPSRLTKSGERWLPSRAGWCGERCCVAR
ncbi:DUF262 domain-containing protein [Blastococcus aurantiacus]|uniref:DUF262 domain-containing protein n=1 Tax=Blastococcus aurantiacus TaxID=1550231 RepID=UPI000AC429A2